jgi:predicted nucleic acid-binding OB-fold protein
VPGAFRVNFINGAESTERILHTLELAVAVGRIMAADLTHDK